MALPRWLELLAARYGIAVSDEPVTWEQLVTNTAGLERKVWELYQRLVAMSGTMRLPRHVVLGYDVIRENQFKLSTLIWTKATARDGGGVPLAQLPRPVKAPEFPYWGTSSAGFGAIPLGKPMRYPARSHVGALGAIPVGVIAVCGAIVALAGAGVVASAWWAAAAIIEAIISEGVLYRQITAYETYLDAVNACVEGGSEPEACMGIQPPPEIPNPSDAIPTERDRFGQLVDDTLGAVFKLGLVAGGIYLGVKLLDHWLSKRAD